MVECCKKRTDRQRKNSGGGAKEGKGKEQDGRGQQSEEGDMGGSREGGRNVKWKVVIRKTVST